MQVRWQRVPRRGSTDQADEKKKKKKEEKRRIQRDRVHERTDETGETERTCASCKGVQMQWQRVHVVSSTLKLPANAAEAVTAWVGTQFVHERWVGRGTRFLENGHASIDGGHTPGVRAAVGVCGRGRAWA